MARKRKDIAFPEKGTPRDQVLREMEAARDDDAKWKDGKSFAYVYYATDEHYDFLKKATNMYFSENALSPMAFPSLKKFESEVTSMIADMLGGDRKTYGSLTTGGTESNLMTVKAHREWAKEKRPTPHPELLVPISAHQSFDKAAHYFGLEIKKVPWDADFRTHAEAMKEAITENTIMIVGSAVEYSRGMVDPIKELGEIAQEYKVGFHVDGCLGGFMLPWVKKLGYPIPDFDMSVPGVTSMSCDIHKYGYGPKGSSSIFYTSERLWKHQFFASVDSPCGAYASPTMTGTRGGGVIAGAWATVKSLGEDGYLRLAKDAMDATKKLTAAIDAMPDLKVLGKPDMTVFAFTARDPAAINIYAVGDELQRRGWILDRLQFPPALHLIVTPPQVKVVDRFIADLGECVAHAKANPGSVAEGAALYGLLATFPDRANLKKVVLDFLADQYKA
ncbi:MAG: aspartate aminotransferase family protein [Candidatus Lokiarchaeota archaeon]|nr:aspartate aminotransferase family protein [Candidatus Lokiarchaeota archaeon]